jgi:ribosomal protein S18 acetylase RimI-like enzyme
MPALVRLDDRGVIEAFLRRDTWRHLFELGDLDDRFWFRTRWFGWRGDGGLSQIALLYTGRASPVLLCYGDAPMEDARAFAEELVPELPPVMYAHIGLELTDIFRSRYKVRDTGTCLQMYLTKPSRIPEVNPNETIVLTPEDAGALEAFYAENFPSSALDTAMLSTRRLLGVKRDGQLVAVAGLHVYSRALRVAALGGIAVHLNHRRQGLGSSVTSALCLSLLHEDMTHIALDVMTDSAGAIEMYERLGFERGLVFQTAMLT